MLSGAPDPGFGHGELPGRATAEVVRLVEVAGVAVQPDGGVVVVGTVSQDGNDDFAVVRFRPDGALDSSFGTTGVAQIGFDLGTGDDLDDVARAVVVQADGKIVVVGQVERPGGQLDFGVARLEPDGRPDVSFGDRGRVVVAFNRGWNASWRDDVARAVAIQPDGKIVVAGQVDDQQDENDFGVTRLEADGRIDEGFGAGGRVVVGFDRGASAVDQDDDATALAIQPDGRILVAGSVATAGRHRDFGVAWLRPDGEIDEGFGDRGQVVVGFDLGLLPSSRNDLPSAVAVQADGRILVAGTVDTAGGRSDFAVLRLLADGSPDASIGGDGRVSLHLGAGRLNLASGLAVQADGRILVAGQAQDLDGGSDFAALRLDEDGLPDPTFGSEGRVILPFNLGPRPLDNDLVRGAAFDGEGRLVLGGQVDDGVGGHRVGVARLLTESIPPKVVRLGPVVPDPRNSPVDELELEFSEPIDGAGVSASALSLTRDGEPVPLGAAVSVSAVPGTRTTYRVSGLGEATGRDGAYTLSVNAASVRDPAGNPGEGGATVGFVVDRTAPLVSRLGPVTPRPGRASVEQVDLVFSEAISAAPDVSSLRLTRNGEPVPLGQGVTIRPVPGAPATFLIEGLGTETAAPGHYVLSVDAASVRDPAGNPGAGGESLAFSVPGLAVPADYDGDGLSDLTTFTLVGEVGRFEIRRSSDGETMIVELGGPGDFPIDGDYDGDGVIDPAVFGFDPARGYSRFLYRRSSDGEQQTMPFGGPYDFPVGGDYDGDGVTDLVVFGFSPDNGFSRFGIVPSGGSATQAERYGAPRAIGLPPFAGLYPAQGGADAVVVDGGSGTATVARRAARPGMVADDPAVGTAVKPAPARPRRVPWFGPILGDANPLGPGRA